MVDFIGAIKKPFSDAKALVIGGILSAIPIASLLSSGYTLKIAEDTMNKKNGMRDWAFSDLVDYLIKAILSMVISIVYFIIPIVVFGVGIGNSIVSILPTLAQDPNNTTAIMNQLMGSLALGAPILIIGVILMLIAAFLLPMAVMKWLKAGKLGAGFGLGKVVKNALTVDYILALIVAIIYGIIVMVVVGIIGAIIALIPIVGFIIMLLINGIAGFAVSVTTYTMIAQTVKA